MANEEKIWELRNQIKSLEAEIESLRNETLEFGNVKIEKCGSDSYSVYFKADRWSGRTRGYVSTWHKTYIFDSIDEAMDHVLRLTKDLDSLYNKCLDKYGSKSLEETDPEMAEERKVDITSIRNRIFLDAKSLGCCVKIATILAFSTSIVTFTEHPEIDGLRSLCACMTDFDVLAIVGVGPRMYMRIKKFLFDNDIGLKPTVTENQLRYLSHEYGKDALIKRRFDMIGGNRPIVIGDFTPEERQRHPFFKWKEVES